MAIFCDFLARDVIYTSGGRGGYGKIGDCSDITYFTYFLSMDRKHVMVRFVYINILVISVENALCLKMVRLITTSDHIGLKRRHVTADV